MHISEGILPIDWASLWFLVAAPFVYGGLRTIERRRREDPQAMTLVAMVGAAIFVISCMPMPVPLIGTCSHPCGTGLGALLIGPGPTVVVASIALVFQALFLAHGGLTTLGANIVSMGVVGAFSALWPVSRPPQDEGPDLRRGAGSRDHLRLGHLRHDLLGTVLRSCAATVPSGACSPL